VMRTAVEKRVPDQAKHRKRDHSRLLIKTPVILAAFGQLLVSVRIRNLI